VQLAADLEKIREEDYGGRGYLRAQLQFAPELDDAARTAIFHVRVEEGALYRFQALVVEGLPAKAVEELHKRWKLKPGEPYSTVYAVSFVKEDVATVLRRFSPRPARIVSSLATDEEQKTVTLTLRFQ